MVQAKFIIVLVLGLVATTVAFNVTTEIQNGLPNNTKIITRPFERIGKGLYYIERKQNVNWFRANEICHQLGAELVSFENIEEWNSLNQYLKVNLIEKEYWTSGNDLAQQHKHVWLATGQPIKLNAIWAPGKPDNVQNLERCDLLGYRKNPSERRGLNDAKCAENRPFICERQQPKTITTVVW